MKMALRVLAVPLGYFAFVLLLFGVGAPLSPARVNQGDKCFRCQRTIVQTRLAGEIVDQHGLAYKFRQPACMAQYLNEQPQPAGALRAVFVSDYTSGLMVPVERAWFVDGVIDPRTNERDYFAFNMRGAADAQARLQGTQVVDWSAVMAEGARRARVDTGRAN